MSFNQSWLTLKSELTNLKKCCASIRHCAVLCHLPNTCCDFFFLLCLHCAVLYRLPHTGQKNTREPVCKKNIREPVLLRQKITISGFFLPAECSKKAEIIPSSPANHTYRARRCTNARARFYVCPNMSRLNLAFFWDFSWKGDFFGDVSDRILLEIAQSHPKRRQKKNRAETSAPD